jgi:hypothetical protein
MEMAVLTMSPEHYVKPDEVPSAVRTLVLACVRPADLHPSGANKRKAAA